MGNVGPGSAAYAFGRTVRTLRHARLWTQDDLARRLSAAGHPMHQTTVAKLESGTRPTDVDEITAIAAIFGIAPAALFDERPSPEEWLRQAWRGLQARRVEMIEERDRLRARLETLDTEYESIDAEYRRLGHTLGEEVDDSGEH